MKVPVSVLTKRHTQALSWQFLVGVQEANDNLLNQPLMTVSVAVALNENGKPMNKINADNYFCIIPEWVLYAPISSHAVRLYGTLQRYADKDSGQCHPSRKTLADRCGLSLSSLDRALIELIDLGAVTKKQRMSSNGDWTSNIYTVITNAGVSSQVTTPIVTDGDTGLVTGDEQTKANVNQSQERNAAQSIADEWWQAYKVRTGGKTPTGKGAWHALIAIVNGSLKAGWTPEQVSTALMACSVPSAAMLDIQLNKNLQPAAAQSNVVNRLPVISGDQSCDACNGSGVVMVFNDDEQKWEAKKCVCYQRS